MKFKEFLKQLREAFYNAAIHAVGSTTFWILVVSIVLAGFKVLPWETVLAPACIYGVNRIGQNATANLAGK